MYVFFEQTQFTYNEYVARQITVNEKLISVIDKALYKYQATKSWMSAIFLTHVIEQSNIIQLK